MQEAIGEVIVGGQAAVVPEAAVRPQRRHRVAAGDARQVQRVLQRLSQHLSPVRLRLPGPEGDQPDAGVLPGVAAEIAGLRLGVEVVHLRKDLEVAASVEHLAALVVAGDDAGILGATMPEAQQRPAGIEAGNDRGGVELKGAGGVGACSRQGKCTSGRARGRGGAPAPHRGRAGCTCLGSRGCQVDLKAPPHTP